MSALPELSHDRVAARDGIVDPFAPRWCRVSARQRETDDVVTLLLDDPAPPHGYRAGQFNMLTAFGVGEVAISLSAAPLADGSLCHTIRDVGAVTHALCASPVGSLIGVRGPFGSDWGVEGLRDADVVVVAGGIGLAPLRGAISWLAERGTQRCRHLYVAIGARSPDQVIFLPDLDAWRDTGAVVELTVDAAPAGWKGHVGLVTNLLPQLDFEPERTVALVCGPEIMMRFVARDLIDRGVSASHVRISLERNMQCGAGLCGHCQLGPFLLCRDGPVVTFADAVGVMSERER